MKQSARSTLGVTIHLDVTVHNVTGMKAAQARGDAAHDGPDAILTGLHPEQWPLFFQYLTMNEGIQMAPGGRERGAMVILLPQIKSPESSSSQLSPQAGYDPLPASKCSARIWSGEGIAAMLLRTLCLLPSSN